MHYNETIKQIHKEMFKFSLDFRRVEIERKKKNKFFFVHFILRLVVGAEHEIMNIN